MCDLIPVIYSQDQNCNRTSGFGEILLGKNRQKYDKKSLSLVLAKLEGCKFVVLNTHLILILPKFMNLYR